MCLYGGQWAWQREERIDSPVTSTWPPPPQKNKYIGIICHWCTLQAQTNCSGGSEAVYGWKMMQPCLTYVPPGHLHGGVPVDIRQQAQAETLRVGWICESVHCQRWLRGVEGLPHTLVQLVVGYRAPEGWLWVSHRLQVCSREKFQWSSAKQSQLEWCLRGRVCK